MLDVVDDRTSFPTTSTRSGVKLKAQVANQTGPAEAVRVINNLATAQVRKGTASLIDVKGLNKEDLQQWTKKTEAFFVGAIKESEITLGWWSAEQEKMFEQIRVYRCDGSDEIGRRCVLHFTLG